MKEVYDLRLNPKFAHLVLGPNPQPGVKVKQLSTLAIQLEGIVGDEVYRKAVEASHSEKTAVWGCNIKRTYSKEEIEQAKLFLILTRYQHGAAEEYGTWYTDAIPCEDCGIGRQTLRIAQVKPFRVEISHKTKFSCALSSQQVGPMHYPHLKFIKRDIFSLWGGETVLSARLAALIGAGGFTGGEMLPIWNTTRGSKSLPDLTDCPTGRALLATAKKAGLEPSDRRFWSFVESPEELAQFDKALWELMNRDETARPAVGTRLGHVQLKVSSSRLRVSDRTIIGDPFFCGSTERCKCTHGEIRGRLNSSLSIVASSWDGFDICSTELFFGGRQGLFRPYRHILFSKRLFDAMQKEGMKGFRFEIVELA